MCISTDTEQGTNITQISKCPAYHWNGMVTSKRNASQIHNFHPVLNANPLVRAVGLCRPTVEDL